MPTVRALAETYDQPVTLVLSPKYAGLADLLRLQPYIAEVAIDDAWAVQETAPMTPRLPPTPIEADVLVHGGYQGWPPLPLPVTIEGTVRAQLPSKMAGLMPRIDLTRPWIAARHPGFYDETTLVCGWSEEHFELKYGVSRLVNQFDDYDCSIVAAPGSRWEHEVVKREVECNGWEWAANRIAGAKVFLGCCSALHVLAVALGKRCVIMEPNPQRHHEIFWPLGTRGPQVTLVRGGDGNWTWDSRHVAEAIHAALKEA